MSKLQELIERYCPDGVEYRSLESIVDMHAGKHISGTQISSIEDSDHPFPCYGGNGLRGYVADYNVEGERVLIGRQGALCGNVKFASGKFYATEHAVICSPLCEFDCRWLLYALDVMNLNQYKTKSAQPGLAVGNIKPLLIPFPPVEVQREIVRLLDAYTAAHDALVDRLNEEIELRRMQGATLVEAKFVSMFGGPASEDGEWNILPLKELTTKIGSGATPKGGKSSYHSEGVSLIRSMNVYDSGFDYDGLAYINEEQADALAGVAVKPGDLLLNITGASIARCCVVPDDVLPARVNQHVCILRVKQDVLSPVFLHAILTVRFMKDYLLKTGESTGSTRQALTKKQIEALNIIVPPMELQLEFVEFINKMKAAAMSEIVDVLASEIDYRARQLNEFRNQLLTFPGKVA